MHLMGIQNNSIQESWFIIQVSSWCLVAVKCSFSFVFLFSSTMGIEFSRTDMIISALMSVIWRVKYLYCKQIGTENVSQTDFDKLATAKKQSYNCTLKMERKSLW